MRVVHINYYARKTGGGIAGWNLHQALLKYTDIDSIVLAVEPCNETEKVFAPFSKLAQQKIQYQQRVLWQLYKMQCSKNYTAHTFNIISNGLIKDIVALHPDIVHLHSIVGEMLSIKEIAYLAKKYPLVWTLHDCWPFTGTSQYPRLGSRRYMEGYTRSNKEDKGLDIDRFLWKMKQREWRDLNIKFISPSNWINDQLQQSKLWKNSSSIVIGNCIDSAIFAPRAKSVARTRLGISAEAKVLGFGASALNNDNKGGPELRNVLSQLSHQGIELMVLGTGKLEWSGLKIHNLGFVSDIERKIDFYNSCDLFLSTSKYDNLPNMIMESMACGTPVAALNIGGISDLIKPENGILVNPKQADKLGEKIIDFFKQESNQYIKVNARQHILKNYSEQKIAIEHLNLGYSSLLSHKFLK